MTDLEFANTVADKAFADNHVKLTVASPQALELGRGRLREALAALVAKFNAAGVSVPWMKILALLPQIIALITSGTGDWSAILQAIIAIFFPAPAPAPNPNA